MNRKWSLKFSNIADTLWYDKHPLRWGLLPFTGLYQLIITSRCWLFTRFKQKKYSTPIIVVGNITVGGVGKTPFVIALVLKFKEKGLQVGVVSRGYGATSKQFPLEVLPESTAAQVGDEPVLIAEKARCPVVISPNRCEAVEYLLKHHHCDVIVSDDGLQHYKMGRAIEIVIIDAQRGLGNEWCLPAGPLREPKRRLKEVDFIIVNSGRWENAYSMTLQPGIITHLNTGESVSNMNEIQFVEAVAAIGNPRRFFATLDDLGLSYDAHAYPDHYHFKPQDFKDYTHPVLMTEKDAVKCRQFATHSMYVLPVLAHVDDAFWEALFSHQRLKDLM
jgi:tetraacyldisaccharide 4'-kinase